jgi:hypothetical protein
MLRVAGLVFVSLALVVTGVAHDSEPINTNFASPFARGAGNLQWRFQGFRSLPLYDLVPVELEYGFAARQQFSVGIPLVRSDSGSQTYYRVGNLEVEYRFLIAGDNRRRFALSLNPGAELPTGDKRVAESSWTVGGTANLDTHLADKWWTHSNIGYFTQVAHISEREKTVVYNNAIMYELSEKVRPVVEVIGSTDIASHQTTISIAPEAIFAPNHHWEIKAAVPIGVTKAASPVGVQVAVVWKFGEHGRQ